MMTDEYKLKSSEGYRKLKIAVLKDVAGKHGCFNPDGCNQGGMIKCSHRYCSKFKWAIDRAIHYGEKTGLDPADILTSWENERGYWYMNFYQECNQPEIKDNQVRVFETIGDLLKDVGPKGFRCPSCGGVSLSPYTCNSNIEVSPGKICDWKSYGLFGSMGKGVTVFVKEKMKVETFFMPLSWEDQQPITDNPDSV